MKRILEENVERRFTEFCTECRTLFDYQDEDLEVEKEEWDVYDRFGGNCHHVRIKTFITCPKCGTRYLLSNKEYSR